MVRRFVIGAVAVASAAAGLMVSRAGGAPVPAVGVAAAEGCPAVPVAREGRVAALAAGDEVLAVADGRLVTAAQQRSFPVEAGTEGVVRHVASASGHGTAYVVDRRGGDVVVVTTPGGSRRIHERTEATHPAWSPSGDLAWATGEGVAVLDRRTGRVDRLRGPVRGGTVFSPVFASDSRLVAGVAAPPSARSPHGARLDNLWVSRLDGHRWRRITDFRARDDRWVAVRTPVVVDGAIHFVRVSGRATATGDPRFELWRLRRGVASRVRTLPDERYLAGSRQGRLLWNVPDPAHGRELLAIEGRRGLRTIGCGSVMTDPIDAVDPDLAAAHGGQAPPRGDWPELRAPSDESAEEIAVIVGDFATSDEARSVVTEIRAEYPSSTVEVVDASTAPFAIRPGVFGALLHLPIDADPTSALATFRSRLPAYSATSWIVTP